MTRYKITAPNADYDGKVGELQFSKGVYEGEASAAILSYCHNAGYDVAEVGAAASDDGGSEPRGYDAMSVGELKAEIERRNELPENADAQLAKSGKKADLIAALTAADDAASDDDNQNGASS